MPSVLEGALILFVIVIGILLGKKTHEGFSLTPTCAISGLLFLAAYISSCVLYDLTIDTIRSILSFLLGGAVCFGTSMIVNEHMQRTSIHKP